jgi:hypothetical protein
MVKENGKITVKHYLNKRALPCSFGGTDFFPLYIQIIAAGNKAQIKSKINDYITSYQSIIHTNFNSEELTEIIKRGYFSEKLLAVIYKEKAYPVYNLLEDELNIVSRLILNNKAYKTKAFTLVNVSSTYENYLTDICDILESAVKRMYINELNRIFLQSTKDTASRKLFKAANYFIHFINWNNSFTNYYEATYEVLPSEIKFLENHLSSELKKTIKALMAFHSKYNFLKRALDKAGKGKFPKIIYLDWLSEGRDFIIREFTKIFGKQKAVEYVNAIDLILKKELLSTNIISPA